MIAITDDKFSERFGFENTEEPSEITIRYEAPDGLRQIIPLIAIECNFTPIPLREIICPLLLVPPDTNNWSEYPNIKDEIDRLLSDCKWYEIYDIIEKVALTLSNRNYENGRKFEKMINLYFQRNGIGWRLISNKLVVRGPEYFEESIKSTINTLEAKEKNTAKNEIHNALMDLSKRPKPDLTGAIQHAMASLECAARNISGSETLTLGSIIKKHPELFPKPLDNAVEKLWGFASEYGRHLRESYEPKYEDVELTVSLCACLTNYLMKKS